MECSSNHFPSRKVVALIQTLKTSLCLPLKRNRPATEVASEYVTSECNENRIPTHCMKVAIPWQIPNNQIPTTRHTSANSNVPPQQMRNGKGQATLVLREVVKSPPPPGNQLKTTKVICRTSLKVRGDQRPSKSLPFSLLHRTPPLFPTARATRSKEDRRR